MGAGLAGWQRGAATSAVERAAAQSTRPVAAPASGQPVPAHRVVEFLVTEPEPATIRATNLHANDLAADDAALIAETGALRALAEDTELELNGRQWSALATVTLRIQAIRQAYEASIANAANAGPACYRVEIPAYAAAGDALRAKFHAALREELGEANATEVLEKLGARLEGHFAGFGVSVQTLDVAGDPRASADYAVTRTVKFWNGVSGDDRLTLRRETHFPGLEDPAGMTWGPLLSVLTRSLESRGS